MTTRDLVSKIQSIEDELLSLKLRLFVNKKVEETTPYSEQEIIKEAQKTRKKMWKEKYAKKVQGIS